MHYLKKKKLKNPAGNAARGKQKCEQTSSIVHCCSVFLYAQFLNCLCKRDHSVAS